MPKVSAKNATILINGYNFSTYFSSFDIESSMNPANVTGFGDGSANFIPTMPSGKISGSVFWDSAADKTHLALKSRPTGHVTIIPETYALGVNSISLPFMQSNYSPAGSPDGVLQVGTLNFESYGLNVGVEQGTMLAHGTITTTTTGTGFVDVSGGAVTAACSGTLHIWGACAADTYVVKIQHCATLGGTYVDLVTFVSDGSSVTSERVSVASGTINAYRRVLATRTGSAGNSFGFSVHFQHQ